MQFREGFEDEKDEIKSWFKKRGYPEDLISSEMRKVKLSNLGLKGNDKNHNSNGIPLVVTHHSFLKFSLLSSFLALSL